MEYRTWITEALRLHFEEHLPRVVAGRRLGVPKSTVCGMFVRFRNAGLSWPLPAGMSEQELDALLYESASTVPVVLTESTGIPKVRNIQVCATLNGIVKIIKAQNLSFFFVKKIIFVKFYDIAEEFASLRCRFSFAWFS
ncbi:Aec51 [Shigella flexneri 2a]|nr:Aec51 [Shigella flexneri 2a]